ncbi:hypothetical protein [Kribbella sp. CA-247076]|uniref:hypothetical protein n=1 Tax=Kribbella sp. CA-247076 TaxID=3239941 RepID=UPI003D91F3A4
MIATQDCELAWTDADRDDYCIEVRPVFHEDPPDMWGIRSQRILLTQVQYLDSQSPRMMLSPRLIAASKDLLHKLCLMPSAARAVKTWLGLRYDRPAVPGIFVDLHMALRSQVTKKSRRKLGFYVRDVMVRYAKNGEGLVTFELFAVLPRSDTPEGAAAAVVRDKIEEWLADIAKSIPVSLGVASQVLAVPADRASIAFLEEAYAVDASDVSWPRGGGSLVGASR